MGFPIKLWGCPVTFPLNQSIDTWYNLCSVVHSTCCLCICIRICKHKTQDHQWQLTHVYPSNACVTHYITRDINPRWAVLIIEESSNGHINMDIWLVVLTILKNISQWEGLSHIIPYIMENKKGLKPPIRFLIVFELGEAAKPCLHPP